MLKLGKKYISYIIKIKLSIYILRQNNSEKAKNNPDKSLILL